jgi:hypothetical protein
MESIYDRYKVRLATLMYNIIGKGNTTYNLRNENNVMIARFEIDIMKNSVTFRGVIVWNLLSQLNNAPIERPIKFMAL